jgi:hypothetical protein
MRLIIFLKIPERVEPIPLDVIDVDDRPAQAVLEDILDLIKLPSDKDNAIEGYLLEKNSEKLNLDLNLLGNGVKNGDTLVLVKSNEKTKKLDGRKIDIGNVQSSHLETSGKTAKEKDIQKKESNVPGKKIDFD